MLGNRMKKMTVVLMAVFCMSLSTSATFAAEGNGPASDPLIAGHDRSAATGPGAIESEIPVQPPETGQEAGQSQIQENGQEAGQSQIPESGQEAGQGQLPEGGQGTGQGQIPESGQGTGQGQLPEGGQETDQTQPEEEAAPESTEGKVFSGGRWIDPSKPMIALTFDDGPYAPVGNRIMDSLEKHNGRATFFVVGNRVPAYKTEIKRMYDNGHEIGNHTYEHKYLTKLSAFEIRSQIDRCSSAVAAVTGEVPRLVRLPGGLKNNTVLANVKYPMIMWNIDTMDWKTRNPQKSYDAVVGKVKDGDIILMHEIYVPSGDAAVRIIPALTEQGFQLVTVSELSHFRGGVSSGKLYNSFRP